MGDTVSGSTLHDNSSLTVSPRPVTEPSSIAVHLDVEHLSRLLDMGLTGPLCVLSISSSSSLSEHQRETNDPSRTLASIRAEARQKLRPYAAVLSGMNHLVSPAEHLAHYCHVTLASTEKPVAAAATGVDTDLEVGMDDDFDIDIQVELLEADLSLCLDEPTSRPPPDILGAFWETGTHIWLRRLLPSAPFNAEERRGNPRDSSSSSRRWLSRLVDGRQDCDPLDMRVLLSSLAVWSLSTGPLMHDGPKERPPDSAPVLDTWVFCQPIYSNRNSGSSMTLETDAGDDDARRPLSSSVEQWHEAIVDRHVAMSTLSKTAPDPAYSSPLVPHHIVGVVQSASSGDHTTWAAFDIDVHSDAITVFHSGLSRPRQDGTGKDGYQDSGISISQTCQEILRIFMAVLKRARPCVDHHAVHSDVIVLHESLSRFTGFIACHIISTLCAIYRGALSTSSQTHRTSTAQGHQNGPRATKATRHSSSASISPSPSPLPSPSPSLSPAIVCADSKLELSADAVQLSAMSLRYLQGIHAMIRLDRLFWEMCDQAKVKITR